MQQNGVSRLAILLGALLVAPASAQDPELPVGVGSLGGVDITKVSITNVGYLDFQATEGGDTVLGTDAFEGTRFPFSGSTARLAASLDNGLIPNGAKIEKICLYYFDDNRRKRSASTIGSTSWMPTVGRIPSPKITRSCPATPTATM